MDKTLKQLLDVNLSHSHLNVFENYDFVNNSRKGKTNDDITDNKTPIIIINVCYSVCENFYNLTPGLTPNRPILK
jgi:hypothetical protein